MGNRSVIVFGATGTLGSEVVNAFRSEGYIVHTPSSLEVNLMNLNDVSEYIRIMSQEPSLCHIVINCAGRVAGITGQNDVNMMYDNIQIGMNVANAVNKYDVPVFINVASSCIYPPSNNLLIEDDLFNGDLDFEVTNYGYALAKYTVMQYCNAFNRARSYTKNITVIPPNLYSLDVDVNKSNQHVIPDVISKFYHTKGTVELLGTGFVRREFMSAEHCAQLIAKICSCDMAYVPDVVNLPSDCEEYIFDVVRHISRCFNNQPFKFDGNEKMNGVSRKKLDDKLIWSIKGFYNTLHENLYEDIEEMVRRVRNV